MPIHPDKDEIMTLTEIAGYLKVSEKTVLRMLRTGSFPGAKVSNQWRFVRAVVDDWLSNRMYAAPRRSLLNVVSGGGRDPSGAGLYQAGLTVMNMKAGSKEEMLRQLVKPLADCGLVHDEYTFVARLLSRETIVSTGIGRGLAVPHIRDIEDLFAGEPCLVVGVCPQGSDFGAIDGRKTYVFLLPCARSESEHLRLMARISLIFRRPGTVRSLVAARSARSVLRLLKAADREISGNDCRKKRKKEESLHESVE